MFHTSPNEIKADTINSDGVAGDCLFFSNNIYIMTACSTVYVYEADFDCVRASQLHDAEIIEEIAERFDVDLETAESLLDDSESAVGYSTDADDLWWLQGKQGECAKKMGFDGCESRDEQGVVYIIPMTGREAELKLVEVRGA